MLAYTVPLRATTGPACGKDRGGSRNDGASWPFRSARNRRRQAKRRGVGMGAPRRVHADNKPEPLVSGLRSGFRAAQPPCDGLLLGEVPLSASSRRYPSCLCEGRRALAVGARQRVACELFGERFELLATAAFYPSRGPPRMGRDLAALPVSRLLLDLDGTVYLGERLHSRARARPSQPCARAGRRRVGFLSNKPLQTRAEYAAKLTRLGVPPAGGRHQLLVVLARYLAREAPGARVFVIGEPPMLEEMRAAGLAPVDDARVPGW